MKILYKRSLKLRFKFWPVIVCLILAFFVAWPTIMPGYFSHHDDLQVMRIFEMRKCITDLQIPCRWVPDMGYGNGYPLFNYYAVSPYYIGAIFSFLLGFLSSAKLLFAIPIFLGAISMYLLAGELFGTLPGILASVLFTYAPYHALDLYVRGDVAESFAIAIIPFCFYFVLKLIKEGKRKYLIGLALSLGFFLTSHNIMTVLFIPVLLLVALYWLITEKRRNLPLLLSGTLIGTGLAAFFIFPAYFEKNLVQIDNLIRLELNFRAHFVNFSQLFFSRFWGYGASVLGSGDTISFQIGWPHWWLAAIAFFIFIINIKSRHKLKDQLPLLLIIIFLFSIFMAHARSAFIWEKIEILKFTQFPWRFLSVTAFSTALLGAFVIWNFKKYQKYALIGLVALTIIFNWSYFKPKQFYFNLTDQQKLSGKLWNEQEKAAILDYLPVGAVEPREPAPALPVAVTGKAEIKSFENKSNEWKFQANLINNTTIEIPVLDFPEWQIKANGQSVSSLGNSGSGKINISFLKGGDYIVSGKFTDTPIRHYSNIVSLLSAVSLLVLGLYKQSLKTWKESHSDKYRSGSL